ncbi:MAG: iron chelate uptake ABC transporter family permease subunit, partial [Rhodoferax sp.]|nr:iron chelate uptake ABC transporter family permease subunit [Rhodoferax sp.]
MNTLLFQSRRCLPSWRVRPAALLVAALLLGMVLAVQSGAVAVHGSDWLQLAGLGGENGAAGVHGATGGLYVLWNIRLPRVFFAVLVGASLGLAGALTQGLFRNPLADPGLLGVSAGAACAAALTLVVFSGFNLPMPPSWRLWLLPAAAFAGALGVCFTLDRIARWVTPGSIAGLLLTGVALNALAAAVIGLCTYLATDEQLRSLSFWTLGSVAGSNWALVALLALALLLAGWRVRQLVRTMNA